MLQPPHHHLSDPGCLRCLCSADRCMRHRGMSSPEAGPWPSPSGLPHACHLLAESQAAAPVAGWKGGGLWQRGQQMPLEATGDLPDSILPQLLSCNWWCPDSSSVIHISTVCHVTFWVTWGKRGRGARLALTFTSDFVPALARVCLVPLLREWLNSGGRQGKFLCLIIRSTPPLKLKLHVWNSSAQGKPRENPVQVEKAN